MDIQQMRYYVQLYEDRSFTKAANNSFISQQGLSRLIKSIEDKYNVNFFRRSPKGIEPTHEGRIMYETCKKILCEFDEMIVHFSNVADTDYFIRLGVTSLICCDELSKQIAAYHNVYPNVRMEFIALGYYDCERYLDNNYVDFCMTVKPDSCMKYQFKHIWTESFVLYMNKKHYLASKEKVYMNDLIDEEFVLLSKDTKGGKLVCTAIKDKGYYPKVILFTSQMSLAFEYICNNNVVGILPRYVVPQAYKQRNDLVCVKIADFECKCDMGIIYLKDKQMTKQEYDFIYYLANIVNLE
jgi:DNA-binding transcriptional LysR family regulator